MLGETHALFSRPDVNAALHLPDGARTGFRFFGVASTQHLGRRLDVEIRVRLAGASAPVVLTTVSVALSAVDYQDGAYGNLCNPACVDLHHRVHIYSSGAPAETPSPECVQLLANYLPRGSDVLDVGCGVGAYAAALAAQGHTWMGAELSPSLLRELTRRGLPHRAIRRPRWPFRYRLPFRDRRFDAAIAIEVLEHTTDPVRFVQEVRRVVRRRACFSVPNAELLAFWAPRMLAPWHMLEGDHRNFFSRFILRDLLLRSFRHVEVFDYGTAPATTRENLNVGYHLFAFADV
ncbi:class I SAM-dependent methyltransferase [Horticoccus luteus]|uniref:Class I SAM-dependent methyltransferase n=2 Tax=Horticoccus luteus TaxID=2862869 RepID=A0A8F9XHY3_9BACT|nr:class I SAM-dependent methyltransferase [Horticoccus luteus]